MVSGNRGNHILELKETPFSIVEGRFFVMKRGFLHTNETPPLSANNSFHSPLHSERGWGRGFPSFANNGFHSPLHSERGWGRGCSWAGVRLVVAGGKPVSSHIEISPLHEKNTILYVPL